MKKIILATAITLMLASSAHAGACSKYSFGSQGWWQCTTNEHSGPN